MTMNTEKPDTLHQLLKKQMIGLHEKAHQIPYIINLLNNNIHLESFVGHLRALAIIYGTLERQLTTTQNVEIKRFLEGYTPKLPYILADLEYFGAKTIKDIIPMVSIALHVADKILRYIEKSPYKLLGFLYTVDGSLNGGSVFKKHLSEIFDLQNGNGISYFSVFNPEFKQYWDTFTEKLDTQIVEDQNKEDIISGACEIFDDIMSIYWRLYPLDEKNQGHHITSLNPEAGNYPIPTDPLEIQSAIMAGIKCWDEFPYYKKRYGERGKRFTVSDAVWLVNLSELSINAAIEQVNWLAKYLSIKGMPTLAIEVQLGYLVQELTKQVPENQSKYKVLLAASENLKNQRTEKVPIGIFEKSNTMFLGHYRQLNVADEYIENTGIMIASSMADNKNGIDRAGQSFKTWITNPDLFSQNWIEAIEKTYFEIENQL